MNNGIAIAYVQYIILWVKNFLGLPKTPTLYGKGAAIIVCRIPKSSSDFIVINLEIHKMAESCMQGNLHVQFGEKYLRTTCCTGIYSTFYWNISFISFTN